MPDFSAMSETGMALSLRHVKSTRTSPLGSRSTNRSSAPQRSTATRTYLTGTDSDVIQVRFPLKQLSLQGLFNSRRPIPPAGCATG